MNKPIDFSDKQLKYLKKILTPYCCHVSGEHDPTHFEKDPDTLCWRQKSKAYERACDALGFNLKAVSEPGCYWCELHNKKREEE